MNNNNHNNENSHNNDCDTSFIVDSCGRFRYSDNSNENSNNNDGCSEVKRGNACIFKQHLLHGNDDIHIPFCHYLKTTQNDDMHSLHWIRLQVIYVCLVIVFMIVLVVTILRG